MKASDVRDVYSLALRMDRHTTKTDTCWNWTAGVTRASQHARSKAMGYGKTCAMLQDGKMHDLLAHRVAYMLWYGEVPDDQCVLHQCHNPRCVRPDHLKLGTQQDNMDDRMMLGRYQWGEEHYNCAVTLEDVEQIRILVAQGMPYAPIADMFKIDVSNVYYIATGKSWARAPGPIRQPDARRRWREIEAKVPRIRKLLKEGWTAPQIATEVGVTTATVHNISQGRAYAHIPDET